MDKIYFRWSERFGEYSLYFRGTGKEYCYKTYDAYFAKNLIDIAYYKPGFAWNKVKKSGLNYK